MQMLKDSSQKPHGSLGTPGVRKGALGLEGVGKHEASSLAPEYKQVIKPAPPECEIGKVESPGPHKGRSTLACLFWVNQIPFVHFPFKSRVSHLDLRSQKKHK